MNVHINHPPEATVQIHQVARVRGDAEVSEENSVEAALVPQLAAMPWYTHVQGNGNSIATEGIQQQQRAPGLLGRCFREALHGQVRGHPSSAGVCVDTFLVLGCGCVGLWGREGGLLLCEASAWASPRCCVQGQQCVSTWEDNPSVWPSRETSLPCPDQAVPWGSAAQT